MYFHLKFWIYLLISLWTLLVHLIRSISFVLYMTWTLYMLCINRNLKTNLGFYKFMLLNLFPLFLYTKIIITGLMSHFYFNMQLFQITFVFYWWSCSNIKGMLATRSIPCHEKYVMSWLILSKKRNTLIELDCIKPSK